MRRLQDFSVDNSKYSLTACSAADPGGFGFSNELRMKYTRLDGERSRAPPLVENQNVCTKAITLARCPAVPSRSDNAVSEPHPYPFARMQLDQAKSAKDFRVHNPRFLRPESGIRSRARD